jgi:hypothetical protein
VQIIEREEHNGWMGTVVRPTRRNDTPGCQALHFGTFVMCEGERLTRKKLDGAANIDDKSTWQERERINRSNRLVRSLPIYQSPSAFLFISGWDLCYYRMAKTDDLDWWIISEWSSPGDR